MTTSSTNREMQRVSFVESLHNSLKKQAEEAVVDQHKFITLASSYIGDGLGEGECIELLMIDGLSREASESYTSLAVSGVEDSSLEDNLPEYSFQFEDAYGKIWSSYDIGKTVRACDETSAIEKADDLISSQENYEPGRILFVSRVR